MFSDRLSNIDEIKKSLVQEVQGQPGQYLDQAKNVALLPDVELPDVAPLQQQIQVLWAHDNPPPTPVPPLAAPNTAAVSNTPTYRQLYRDFLFRKTDDVEAQIAAWKRAAEELSRSAYAFDDRAGKFAKRVSEYFTEQNTGRIGGVLTQQHAAILTASYNLWLSAYADGLEACRSALIVSQDALRGRFNAIGQDLTIRLAAGPPDGAPVSLASIDAPLKFAGPCASIVPTEAEYLKERRGPSDALGFIGKAAKWLLATELRDLALITGLLAFGIFGALAASFIRQTAAAPGQTLPTSGWIVPALIRGVAAAVLVFLAVVGGLSVFTQAGPEPRPNPYAVFFTCFIAAVFSEDVWLWARRQQGDRLRVDRRPEPSPEPRPQGGQGVLVPSPPPLPPPRGRHPDDG